MPCWQRLWQKRLFLAELIVLAWCAWARPVGAQFCFYPMIDNQPASLIVLVGTNATFNVGVHDQGPGCPFTYAWRDFGAYISNATYATYTLTNVQLGNVGSYSVIVTDSSGSVPSSAANLSVVSQPMPLSQTAHAGTDVTFRVSVNAVLPGAGPFNLTLTLTNVQPPQSGPYALTVSNPAGSVTTSNAMLSVLVEQPPRLSGLRWGTNGARFDVTGETNMTYRVQATMGWTEWIDIATNTVPASGTFPVLDPDASEFSWRCYRVITP
jgi:hypothetical protein